MRPEKNCRDRLRALPAPAPNRDQRRTYAGRVTHGLELSDRSILRNDPNILFRERSAPVGPEAVGDPLAPAPPLYLPIAGRNNAAGAPGRYVRQHHKQIIIQ